MLLSVAIAVMLSAMPFVSHHREQEWSALHVVRHAVQTVQHAAYHFQACLWQHCIRCESANSVATLFADSVIRQVVQYVSSLSNLQRLTYTCALWCHLIGCCVCASVGYRLIGCECEQLDFEPMAYQASADSIHAVQRSRLL